MVFFYIIFKKILIILYMSVWLYVVLSALILLLIFPFKITGLVEFYGNDPALKLSVFLFTYNLVSSDYLLIDGTVIRKSKIGDPSRWNIELGKRGANRVKLALKPEKISVDLQIYGEDGLYVTANALNTIFDVLKRRLSDSVIKFDYIVRPIWREANVNLFGKCVFRTSILRLLSSMISCTMKDVVNG